MQRNSKNQRIELYKGVHISVPLVPATLVPVYLLSIEESLLSSFLVFVPTRESIITYTNERLSLGAHSHNERPGAYLALPPGQRAVSTTLPVRRDATHSQVRFSAHHCVINSYTCTATLVLHEVVEAAKHRACIFGLLR